nr:C-type lectin 10 [Bitis atropos]
MGRFIFIGFGLLVVFLSLSGTGADQGCLSGWSSHEGHCYKVFDESKSWADAEKFCRKQAKGGHLVSIENKEEADFVAKLVSENIKKSRGIVYVWIGLKVKDRKQHCSSEWSDGSSINYQKLIKHEIRKCLALEEKSGYHKWENVHCGFPNAFTCEV